uniref:TIL domain-containing protein n=1 Tax=Anopheles funestus TaxID=62324 RepID=A0A4Y0BGX6_ANOFN
MKLLVVFSVLLLAGCLEAQRCVQQKCPANEVWSCCPPCPQKSCFEQIKPQCPGVCRPGCVCIAGYVRGNNSNGRCIPEKSCPPVTKAPQ